MKSKIAKLLALFAILSSNINVNALSLKNNNISYNKSIGEKNQNIDERKIIEKCIELNERTIEKINDFQNCYNFLSSIVPTINDWYKRYEDTIEFQNIRENIFKKQKGLCGGSTNPMSNFYKSLGTKEKEEFDANAKQIKNQLYTSINDKKEFVDNSQYQRDISNIIDEFDKLYKDSINEISVETQELLKSQKQIISELEKIREKIEKSLDKWKEFIENKEFYTRKIHVGCRFSYSEQWLNCEIDPNKHLTDLNQQKSILNNLKNDFDKILKK